VAKRKLVWQSKLILLMVVPFAAANTLLQAHWWATQFPAVAIWTLGLSLLLGIIVLWLRAATPAASFAGVVITSSLMFSTAVYPYPPWRTALSPLMAVFVLAFAATRIGRGQKERRGTAESRRGRSAGQIAANLGFASLLASYFVQEWLIDSHWFSPGGIAPIPVFAPVLAALAEAAADTVSSEVGQVLGGSPRMITNLRRTDPGTDGGITVAGTIAGVVAAAIVTAVGSWALFNSDAQLFWVSLAGGSFGFLFDSLLGATLERRGWLNNDAVNFLSTASAAAFALGVLAIIPHPGVG
jgi:uncharacterized protein (TIGR00297 family)